MTAVSEAIARITLGQALPGDRELVAQHGKVLLPVSETKAPQQVSRVAQEWAHDYRHDERFIKADNEWSRTRSQAARDEMAAIRQEYEQAARERAQGQHTGLIPSSTLPQPTSVPVPDDMRAQPYQRPPKQTSVVHRSWEDLQAGSDELVDELRRADAGLSLRGTRPTPPIAATTPVAPPPPSLEAMGTVRKASR